MQWLEHKVPPPVVAAVVGLAMWGVAPHGPTFALDPLARYGIAGVLFAIALAFDLSGLLAFRAKRTTINPLAPQRASALVTGGVYRVTRNPMYVGLCFILLAWTVYLSALLPIIGPIFFIAYVTRFQIVPEERVLRRLFGNAYLQYAQRVRRWL